jgi:hypothetical protein
MPTPTRIAVEFGEPGRVSARSSWESIGTSEKKRLRREGSREGPPRTSAVEEACDQRSEPQDVTSSRLDTEGSICNKRSCLTRPKDLLSTSLED